MIAMPASATPEPSVSQVVGRMPSDQPQPEDGHADIHPPYAAYTCPEAAGCSVSNQANSARLAAAGSSNHALRPPRSHR